jgi:hypothetical protein
VRAEDRPSASPRPTSWSDARGRPAVPIAARRAALGIFRDNRGRANRCRRRCSPICFRCTQPMTARALCGKAGDFARARRCDRAETRAGATGQQTSSCTLAWLREFRPHLVPSIFNPAVPVRGLATLSLTVTARMEMAPVDQKTVVTVMRVASLRSATRTSCSGDTLKSGHNRRPPYRRTRKSSVRCSAA